jgi:hypothetical protein
MKLYQDNKIFLLIKPFSHYFIEIKRLRAARVRFGGILRAEPAAKKWRLNAGRRGGEMIFRISIVTF